MSLLPLYRLRMCEKAFLSFEYTKRISLQCLNWRNAPLASLLAAVKEALSPVRLTANHVFFFFSINCTMCLGKRWRWKISMLSALCYHITKRKSKCHSIIINYSATSEDRYPVDIFKCST